MSLLFSQLPQREAMAWHMNEGEHHPVVHSVRNAGFHGYVDMSADRAEEYGQSRGGSGEFDEDLWDQHSPEPTHEENQHQEEHGEYPSSFHERHDQAYQQAMDHKAREDEPDHSDDELMDFVGNHGNNKPFWQQHAKLEDVSLHQPVFATQSHVSQSHLDKYHQSPGAQTHTDRGDNNYLGDEAPLMVTHHGRLHTIEGHHRTAAALQRGDSHIQAWHYNADEHGGLPDEDGNMPGHEDYYNPYE